MSQTLNKLFLICEQMISSCDMDYNDLKDKFIDTTFFDDYNNTRIVNSFLFNFSKLQDKIGAKLLKQLLYELKEIDSITLPMIDVLNRLEKLDIVNKDDWEKLREVRNLLAYEYPFEIEERVENIGLVLESYRVLKDIYTKVKDASKRV
ncbi:MAG: hypothetical protein KU38_01425 [Sulfurovum sp. FS08-3]|nr:MAG: hypothetical protein KU38_01425 [Sulfurovum sp. FS08-3]